MKVLYVVGSNLSRNTSANISHNAYVQGLLENAYDVDILMASASWGENDSSLPVWPDATYYIYDAVSIIDRLKIKVKKLYDKPAGAKDSLSINDSTSSFGSSPSHPILKGYLRKVIKKSYEVVFNTSQLYNLNRTWLNNAEKFKKKEPYDLIISNSSPASSHKLVLNLLERKRIQGARWIQIWEDPWFYDIYGGHSKKVEKEEHRLLKAASEIFYVSNLTLKYQKIHFQDCSHKMKHIPLPYLQFGENKLQNDSKTSTFGYFGDYYSKTRNLKPFYDALLESRAPGYINGDTDLQLESTDLVQIGGRVTLDKLSELQDKTSILVHLSNLRGGQIPGKIYHYSATTKPILFILDGSPEEIIDIKDYFKQFNRYYFCENKKSAILEIMKTFVEGKEKFEKQPVLDFAPFQVIFNLLNR